MTSSMQNSPPFMKKAWFSKRWFIAAGKSESGSAFVLSLCRLIWNSLHYSVSDSHFRHRRCILTLMKVHCQQRTSLRERNSIISSLQTHPCCWFSTTSSNGAKMSWNQMKWGVTNIFKESILVCSFWQNLHPIGIFQQNRTEAKNMSWASWRIIQAPCRKSLSKKRLFCKESPW